MSAISRIVVTDKGVEKTITVDDWKAMPLTDRVAMMNAQGVKFFSGSSLLTAREAIAALKA